MGTHLVSEVPSTESLKVVEVLVWDPVVLMQQARRLLLCPAAEVKQESIHCSCIIFQRAYSYRATDARDLVE